MGANVWDTRARVAGFSNAGSQGCPWELSAECVCVYVCTICVSVLSDLNKAEEASLLMIVMHHSSLN